MRKERLAIVKIDESKCTGCGLCVDACPVKAITLEDVAKNDESLCRGCCVCMDECPNDAIYLSKKKPHPRFRGWVSLILRGSSPGPRRDCTSGRHQTDNRQTFDKQRQAAVFMSRFLTFSICQIHPYRDKDGALARSGMREENGLWTGRGRGGGNRRHM
jgi:ferredoxin